MSDTSENAPTATEVASNNETSLQSEETKNTSNNNETLFNRAYGQGVAKGKKELLSEFGTDDLDSVRAAIQFKQEYEDSQKSATEKHEGLVTEVKQLKKDLKGYQERERTEATKLLDGLTDEQKQSVQETGLPIEKLVPMIKTLAGTSSQHKSVGTPFSPSSNDEQESSFNYNPKQTGLDPEYKKNPQAYIRKKMEEAHRQGKL